jgi:4-hydroxy-tetrahydrodipicolinate reductase
VILVGVIGHAGRMGAAVCRAVEADEELELVARVGRDDDLQALHEAGVDVAVEFTSPDTVVGNIRWCVEHGIDVVVGTSGISDDSLAGIERLAKERARRVFIAPNFALGAVLMMSFAARAAEFYSDCEIVERHHEKKLDAPSGTALRTADLIAAAREARGPRDPGRELLAGSRGGDAGGLRVHSLRLPGSVAHQEVVFGGVGETLTIRHDSIDRASFMPGVLLAVKRIGKTEGVTVGLEHLLDLQD